jgi:iron complex outermembrane recepter protein
MTRITVANTASNGLHPVLQSQARFPMPISLRWILSTAALLSAQFALADDPVKSDLTEDTFLADVPLVLGATRLSQPVSESPSAMTVITREMISASGALDIPEVLRLVPGFQVAHVNGHWYTVTYHGLSDAYARRMQVLIDGRSVYTPAYGGVFWSDIPLAIEDVDRIEVIRGPNGATFGANSFSAVVNIITRHSSQTPGLLAQYTQGDLATKNGLLRLGGSEGDFSYRTTVGYRQDDGLPETSDARKVKLFTFRGDYRANPKDSLEIQFGYNGGTRGDGTENGNPTSEPARDRDVLNHFQQLRWRHMTSANEEVSVQFYHNYRRSLDTYIQAIEVNPFITIYPEKIEDYRDERFDVEFQHIFSFGKDWRIVWGAEARRDRILGPGWFGTDSYITSDLYRLFANGEWHLRPDTIVNIGSMYEWNGITGGDISPRLAVNYHVVPGQTLRAGVSRANRTPSFLESRANSDIVATVVPFGTIVGNEWQGNDALEPERITSYEIGWHGESASRRGSADLKIFREKIRNAIAASGNDVQWVGNETLPIITFTNDGEADTRGAEAEIRWQPIPTTEVHLAAAYARQSGYMRTQTTPVIEYTDVQTRTPIHTYSAMVMQQLPAGFEASAAYFRTSEMVWTSDDVTRTRTLDARLAYNLREGRVRGKLAIVAQNLLKDYYDYEPAVVLKRRYLFTAGFELR